MKKRNTETRKPGTITAKLEEPIFLEALIERLADLRSDKGYARETVPPDFKAIDTSTIEAFVSGDLVFSDEVGCKMPFTTSFLFTCTKGLGGCYTLSWSNSLS